MHPPITTSPRPQTLLAVVEQVSTEAEALLRSSMPFEDAMQLALAKVEIAYADLHRLAALPPAPIPTVLSAPARPVVVDMAARRPQPSIVPPARRAWSPRGLFARLVTA